MPGPGAQPPVRPRRARAERLDSLGALLHGREARLRPAPSVRQACQDGPVSTPEFRPDLYRGTAHDYDQFRPAYPAILIADLASRTGLAADGWLLDLACGTG